MLQHERDQKVRIEKMVEQLARQHSHLEEAAQHALPSAAPAGGHRASRNNFFFYINAIANAVINILMQVLRLRTVVACNDAKKDGLECSFIFHTVPSFYLCTLYATQYSDCAIGLLTL